MYPVRLISLRELASRVSAVGTGAVYQLTNAEGDIVDDNRRLKFNDLVHNTACISNHDGKFIVHRSGKYDVHFWACIDGTECKPSVTLGVNGLKSTAPNPTCHITGHHLLDLCAGDEISIKNENGEKIVLTTLPIQAGVKIVYLGA